MWVSIAGVVAVGLYAGLAALQLLVLGPLDMVPGLTIDEIRSGVLASGESMGEAGVIAILGAGVVIGVFLAVVVIRARVRPALAAMGFLVMLMLGAPVLFHSSFIPGMAVADAFAASGGAMTFGLLPFYAISIASGILLIIGALVVARRERAAATVASVTN